MPVHLFGRPAPLDAARRARPAARRGRGAGVRRRRDRDDRASARRSASSRRRTCSRSATAASSPCPDDEVARARPHAPLPRLARQAAPRARRHELPARRDPGGVPARLPAAPRRLERLAARSGGALRRARARRARSSCRVDEPGHVYHLFVVRTPDRERIAARLDGGRDRLRVVLRDAAPPPAGAALPRLRARARSPRPSARRRRTSPCRCGAASARTRSERVVETVLAAAGVARLMRLLNRHRLWHVAVDARDRRARVVARLAPPLRPDPARSTTTATSTGTSCCSSSRSSCRLRPLRLLQPLVALRLDARHVGRAPRRRARRRSRSTSSSRLLGPPRQRPARRLVHRPAPLPRVRRRRAHARADADRAAAARADRRARQGGARRRRR